MTKKQLQQQIDILNDKFLKLEEGVMHDDYPKCIPKKGAGFCLCKHGRLTIGNFTGGTEIKCDGATIKSKRKKK